MQQDAFLAQALRGLGDRPVHDDALQRLYYSFLLLQRSVDPGVRQRVHFVARNGEPKLLLNIFELEQILKTLDADLLRIRLRACTL